MYFYGCMSTALVRKILALGSNDHASKSLSLGRNKLVFGRNILSSGSKICSKVLLLIFVLLFTSLPNIRAQIRFEQGSSFRYLKGNANHENPEALLSKDYDDSQWSTGSAPFRYGKGSGGTVLSDMQNNYTCFYLRSTFRAENVDRLEQLDFTINYDDGFVIAINGQIVLRQNVPASLLNNSLALNNHDPGTNENFRLNAADIPLVEGDNSLAVMVLNVSSYSSDIYFDPGMTAEPALPPFPYGGKVQISREAGFYDAAFDVVLQSPYRDCNILFSFDGSEPATSSTAIKAGTLREWRIDPTQPISRGQTPAYVLRACLVKEGYKPSVSITRTYIFSDKVKTQTYPGWQWPTSPHNGQRLDYEMDSAVIYDEDYAPYIDAALRQIPSISIVTDMDNLFSVSSGIYVNAEKSGRAWERPCSIELIDTCSTKGFQINGGLRIRGAASAKQKESAKRAFRLYFRAEYGASKLKYPLFDNEGVAEFDCIDLRCEQNYAWSKDGSKYNSMIADIFSRDLQGRMKQPYKRGRYYHLYLNGMYWGLYQTDERAEADNAEHYFGGNEDDYDVVKVNSEGWPYFNEATDGNLEAWTSLWNKCVEGFTTNEAYLALLGKKSDGSMDPEGRVWVDIDNLIDYMLVIFYTGNFDAPTSAFYGDDMPNNFYAVYNRNDHSRGFRFFAHDSEHSMFVDNVNSGGLNCNRVNIGSNGSMLITGMLGFNPQWLHYKLCSNQEYRFRFMDRAYKYLSVGGLLRPDSAAAIYRERAAQIDQAVITESARWGDAVSQTTLGKKDWETLLNSMYSTYFPKRSNILIQQLKTEGLYTSIAAPGISVGNYRFYGSYYPFQNTITVNISNLSGQNSSLYYTLDGSDPRIFGGGISSRALNITNSLSFNLDQSTILSCRIYSGTNWGPLKQVFFSRADEDYRALKITEIHYHPKDTFVNSVLTPGQDFEFIEFKNTGNKAIDLSGLKIDSGISHRFPEQELLYPGEFYVAASKPNNFFSRYGRYPSGSFSRNLANSGEKIVLLDADNQPLISFDYYDNSPWPPAPDGSGYTLTAAQALPEGDPGDYSYWMASSLIGGSPFADDPGSAAAINKPGSLLANRLEVYPNPCKGLFFVNTGQNESYRLRMYDSKARLVFDSQFEGIAAIDLSAENLSRGLYILRVELPTEVLSSKLIYLP